MVTKKVDCDEIDDRMHDDFEAESTIAMDSSSAGPIRLLYSHKRGIYNQPASARKPNDRNVMDQAIAFWCSAGDWEFVLVQLNYDRHGDIPTTNL